MYFLDFDSYFLPILHFLLDVKFLNLNTLVTKDIYFYHLTNWDNIIIIIIYYHYYLEWGTRCIMANVNRPISIYKIHPQLWGLGE